MSLLLDALAPGFADPVLDAQACFRAALDAMSRPGRAVELPVPARADEAALSDAAAALLLTLLDAETTVSLAGALRSDHTLAWLRFHTGARPPAAGAGAHFTLARADELDDGTLWTSIPLGSDEQPQDGGTLIVELPRAAAPAAPDAPRVSLRGPGIAERALLQMAGIPLAFWRHRIALEAQFPRGVDLMFTQGRSLTAIPRTTRIALEP